MLIITGEAIELDLGCAAFLAIGSVLRLVRDETATRFLYLMLSGVDKSSKLRYFRFKLIGGVRSG